MKKSELQHIAEENHVVAYAGIYEMVIAEESSGNTFGKIYAKISEKYPNDYRIIKRKLVSPALKTAIQDYAKTQLNER